MLIALQKKEENIAEYILYMWQLEDILRANKFDFTAIKKILVDPLQIAESQKAEIAEWYSQFIDKMKTQKLVEKGHLSELNDLLIELNYLHDTLLKLLADKEYEKLYLSAKFNIDALKNKSGSTSQKDEVYVCLSGLYGLLMLRLKKQNISAETTEAMQSISKMIAYLALKYKTLNQKASSN